MENQYELNLATLIHIASAVSWGLSLEKALSKGGVAWIPVFIGATGHLIAWQMEKNQNVQSNAMPQY